VLRKDKRLELNKLLRGNSQHLKIESLSKILMKILSKTLKKVIISKNKTEKYLDLNKNYKIHFQHQ
jgi:hypothetical protein